MPHESSVGGKFLLLTARHAYSRVISRLYAGSGVEGRPVGYSVDSGHEVEDEAVQTLSWNRRR